MPTRSPLDAEMYPPFEGFPKEGLTFLRKLKRNNTRPWFAAHRAEYEDCVKLPMQSLIAALRARMAAVAPEIEFNPGRSMFRVHRDTRFSRDKTPYKTHAAAVFHMKGHWQESAGYYLHIEPGELYAGGGIYMPASDQLKKIRTAIAEHGEELRAIAEATSFRKHFGQIEGERLLRPPQGYPAGHPMLEYLKLKSFYAGRVLEEGSCLRPGFVEEIAGIYARLLPFVRFLNRALGGDNPGV